MVKKPDEPRFTWTNKQVHGRNIQDQLDWLLVNEHRKMLFPRVSHLHFYNYDHRVLLVDTFPSFKFRPLPFCIEAMWLQDIIFRKLVNHIWAQREYVWDSF